MEFDISTITIIYSVATVNNRQTKRYLVTLVTSPVLMWIKLVQPHFLIAQITVLLKLTPILREIWG